MSDDIKRWTDKITSLLGARWYGLGDAGNQSVPATKDEIVVALVAFIGEEHAALEQQLEQAHSVQSELKNDVLALSSQLAAAEARVKELDEKVVTADNGATLIAVICGHDPDEPLFNLIEPVELVKQMKHRLTRLDEVVRWYEEGFKNDWLDYNEWFVDDGNVAELEKYQEWRRRKQALAQTGRRGDAPLQSSNV